MNIALKRLKAQLLDIYYYGGISIICGLTSLLIFLIPSWIVAKENANLSEKLFVLGTIVFAVIIIISFISLMFRDLYKKKISWGYEKQGLRFVNTEERFSSLGFALTRTTTRVIYYVLQASFFVAIIHIYLTLSSKGKKDLLDYLMGVVVKEV